MAEARIIVRPDTTAFRAELEAQLRAVTQTPITVPVAAVAAGGVNGLAAATSQLSAANSAAIVTTEGLTVATNQETAAVTRATTAQTAHATSLAQVRQGALSSGLSLFGIRGATLAASSGFLAAAAAVTAFSRSLQSAADFETQLNVFRVSSGATADELERVSETAQQLGRDLTLPGVTAGDAAEAMTLLARAGLSVEDSLSGARGALQLATAAQIDNATAVDLVAGSLNSFGLAGTEAIRVADLLAGAAQESQGEIEDLGLGLQQVQGTAANFGVSLEDTVTALTVLTRTSLSARQAGTGLNVALIRLASNKDARDFVEGLGIEIEDINDNIRPEVFLELGEAMSGMSLQAQRAAIATNFGRDAMKAILPLVQAGVSDFAALRAAVSEEGLAAEQAAARTQGLQGSMENLSNQVGALGLTFGQAAKGPIKALVDRIASSVGTVNDFAQAMVNLKKRVDEFFAGQEDRIPFLEEIRKTAGPTLKNFDSDLEDNMGTLERFRNEVTETTVAVAQFLGFDPQAVESLLGGINVEEEEKKVNGLADLAKRFAEAVADIRATFNEAAAAAGRPVDFGLGVPQLENVIAGFDAQEVRARIAGSNAALLDVLRREQAFLERQLLREFVQNRPKLRALLEQALLGVVEDIRSITDQAKAEAAAAKRAAEQAAAERQQALLAAFSLERDQQQNQIARAAQTEGLRDDIRAQQGLRALVLEQIKQVTQRIKDEKVRAAALVALEAILIQVDAAIKGLIRQQRETQEAQRQALVDAARLDVEFAQITDNEDAEIAARERLIARLKKQQALVKKNTNEWKRLRNLIAQENEAIEELRGEKDKQNNLFAQASFEFLQAQQGFASTLLGNLIPRSATTGLVGGQAQQPVQQALQPQANLSDARATSGVTAGQANATNQILIRILEQLKELNGEQKAPEARRQMAFQNSTMDYGPGI